MIFEYTVPLIKIATDYLAVARGVAVGPVLWLPFMDTTGDKPPVVETPLARGRQKSEILHHPPNPLKVGDHYFPNQNNLGYIGTGD